MCYGRQTVQNIKVLHEIPVFQEKAGERVSSWRKTREKKWQRGQASWAFREEEINNRDGQFLRGLLVPASLSEA